MKRNLFNQSVLFLLSVFTAVFIFGTASYAQTERTIRGKVTSKESAQNNLVGVTVTRKGTSPQTTITEVNGDYSITAKIGDVLAFAYVGYALTQITVGQANEYNISMPGSILNLSDVVVVGYGTSTRKDITGAVSSVKVEQIQQTMSPTFDRALQGRVAGVVVNSNSGLPGGGVSVQIRGIATLGNAQPLYVCS